MNNAINIRFNKPYTTDKEIEYIKDTISSWKLSGEGIYIAKCQQYFEKQYGFKKALLTTSCSDALEMCAILLDIKFGDEVIIPSFTFVSTANAFVLRGANIIFADSSPDSPNIDVTKIESLITERTKAIVVIHYGGIACDMDTILDIAHKHNIYVIEDAAHCINSYYKGRALGSLGHMSTFSFHETKNITSGEGGMLVINDERFIKRAEIIRDKGTNRAAFCRGEVDKYGWVDIGSSFIPADILAAFLYAQIERLSKIQKKRILLWSTYYHRLKELEERGLIFLPKLPEYATNNGHIFYIVTKTPAERTALIKHLKDHGIQAVIHYQSLHNSVYYSKKFKGGKLPYSDMYSDCLLRLPIYYELGVKEVKYIIKEIKEFFSLS